MMDQIYLNGKRALVGGSTQGMGEGIAKQFAELGASVVLVARNEEKLKKVLSELANNGSQNHSYVVADYNEPEELGKGVMKELRDNGQIHILINNTGGPPPGKAIDAELDEFITAFRIHLLCNQMLTKLIVPGMKEAKYGRIINIISTSVKQPIPNLGVSNTTRGAVANWAKTLSQELAEFGITVNNILPGFIKTGRLTQIVSNRAKSSGKSEDDVMQDLKNSVPAKRIGDVKEIGYIVGFLASPAASYINGINVPVDGGRTASL